MSIDAHVRPWSGYAVRHIPDCPGGLDIYDFSYCGRSNENRWNVAGEPTIYLAKEKDVALAELARHYEVNRAPILASHIYSRKVYRFRVKLKHTLDLRDREVCKELSLTNVPDCFKEMMVARATAHFIRNTTKVQALIVPSMAFLDDMEKWCLVLFIEKLPVDSLKYLPWVKPDGCFRIT